MTRIKKILIKCFRGIQFILGGHSIWKFYPAKFLIRFVVRKLRLDYVFIDGHKLFLDANDSLRLSINGTYSEFETNFMKSMIKKESVVLDLGANIGYYTLMFAKLVGKNGKVFAFEPDPTNFKLLKKNVKVNGYKNVVLVNKAISNKNGKLKLFLGGTNFAGHRIYDSKDGRKFIEIHSVRLDDYFKNKCNKVDFIKMDIEGSEFLAVNGMHNLLNENQKIKIISEFSPKGIVMSGFEPIDYLKSLINLGFKLSEVNETKAKIIPLNNPSKKFIQQIEKHNYKTLLCEKE